MRNIPHYPIAEIFPCPDWMPEEGKLYWNDNAPMLLRGGVLTDLDRGAFEMLCLSYSLMRQAAADLATKGLSTQGDRGLKKSPAATIFQANAQLFHKIAADFGLTPRSREMLDIQPMEDDDDFLEDDGGRTLDQWVRKQSDDDFLN
jgi:P27 family predicted phage terminase small subunit